MSGAALLDVDGTLVDSTYLHALAWWRALAKHGRPVSFVDVHQLIGMASDQLMESLLGKPDEAIKKTQGEEFAPLKGELRAFPGAADLIRTLHGRGVRVVLATSSKPEDLADLRKVIAADDAIDEVVSSGDVAAGKPEPDIFRSALDRAGTDAKAAVALGDSVWDIEAAGRSGVECVGVETGGASREDLRRAGAVAVYKDVAELLGQLDGSPFARLLRT
jgi:HAD superfamily hydrolase (TIGR01509 family)